jgi:hypothetical protein
VTRREAYHNAGIVLRLRASKIAKQLLDNWMSLLFKPMKRRHHVRSAGCRRGT